MATVLGLSLSIPAIVLLPMVGEIECELCARRELPPGYVSLEERLQGYVMRAMLLFGLAVAGPRLIW